MQDRAIVARVRTWDRATVEIACAPESRCNYAWTRSFNATVLPLDLLALLATLGAVFIAVKLKAA